MSRSRAYTVHLVCQHCNKDFEGTRSVRYCLDCRYIDILCKVCKTPRREPRRPDATNDILYCSRECRAVDMRAGYVYCPTDEVIYPDFYRLVGNNLRKTNRKGCDRFSKRRHTRKSRSCLRCGDYFITEGPGNRICASCAETHNNVGVLAHSVYCVGD